MSYFQFTGVVEHLPAFNEREAFEFAFGRGEWWGVGLGNSVQKLFYLPEAHTDFIFAIFAEEFGMGGVLVMLALFITLIARILIIGRAAADRQQWFVAYAVLGFGIMLAGQIFINLGVTSGLLPTKGLTLPFVSYGGSSLMICSVIVALVLRAGMEAGQQAQERVLLNAGDAGDGV